MAYHNRNLVNLSILVLGYDSRGDVKTDVLLGEQLVVTVTRPDKK